MTSEIRTNSLKSRAGLSTVTMTDSGPMFSGITTFVDNSGFTFGVGSGSSIFTPATNVLTFGTNSNERLRIDSSGDMGLGTSTIENFGGGHVTLEVAGSTTSQGGVFKTATSDSAGTGSSGTEMIMFTDNTKGAINVVSSDPLTFSTANTERLRIDAGGGVQVGTSTVTASKLTVYGANDASAIFQGSGTGTGAGNGFIVGNNGGSTGLLWNYENGYTLFGTNNIERLRITSDGKFSLGGNATPSAAFLLDYDSNNLLMLDNTTASTQKIFFAQNASTHAQIYATSNTGALTIESDPSNNHSSSYIDFRVDGGEKLRIDSAGRVMIGTTIEGHANADDLTIANSGEGGITIRSGSSSNGNIFFSDATSGAGEYAGIIDYKHGSNIMSFGTSGTENFRIGASGDYGTVETRTTKNGWGGYSIMNGTNYVFMGDSTQVGIYNDTDNDWMLTATKGGDTFLYSNGSQTLRSYVTGDYASIQTIANKNGWGGYSIDGQYVFMADASNSGIYNDIDNEWMMYCTRNGAFHLFHDNTLYLNSSGGYLHMAQDARLESKPNSTWGAGFYFGGNGTAANSTHASLVVTNGNIHMDPRNGSFGTYLNWYSGSAGTLFGNAASGQAGRIETNGNMTISGGYSGSDLRLKENIKNITGATDIIKSLVGKTYNWKKGIGLDDWNHYGLIAQEVQKVAPDLVRDNGSQFFDKDDNLVSEFDPTESDEDRKNKGLNQSLTVNYEGVTPILVEAMKELIAKIESLEQENITLRSRVTNLEGE